MDDVEPTNLLFLNKKPVMSELFNTDDFLPGAGLVNQIVKKVSQLIEYVDLPPGELIAEKEIADSLGISKTPVREAFVRLEEQNFVKVVPRVGTYVKTIDVAGYLEACYVREKLECAAVRDAANSSSEQTKRALFEPLLAQQEEALEADAQSDFYELDQALHQMFFEIAGVPGVWKTITRTQTDVNRIRHLKCKLGISQAETLTQEHKIIVDAVCVGDADTASAALLEHLSTLDSAISNLGQQPELLAFINQLNANQPRRRKRPNI